MLNIGGELAFVLTDIEYNSKKELLDSLRHIREELRDYPKDEKEKLRPILAVSIQQAFYASEWELLRYKNFCKYRSEHGFDKVIGERAK